MHATYGGTAAGRLPCAQDIPSHPNSHRHETPMCSPAEPIRPVVSAALLHPC